MSHISTSLRIEAPPIDIPVPGLVVLVGAAGAGKTTFAARWFAPAEILSSNALRASVSGDPTDQRATRPAFAILHREVARRLVAGRLVVVDATNVEPGARAALRRIADAAAVPSIAIALVPPRSVVHARNAERAGRVVPAGVVDRHLARLHHLGPDAASIATRLISEGFGAARVLSSVEEIDATAVRRVERPID
jgi:predicted kinase